MAVGGAYFALIVEVPEGRRAVTNAIVYERGLTGWAPQRVIRGAGRVVPVRKSEIVFARAAGRAQSISYLDLARPDMPETEIRRVPGRVGSLLWRPDEEALLLTFQPPAGTSTEMPGALRTTKANFSLADTGEPWRVATLSLDGSLREERCPPALTGEITWAEGGRMAGGIAREERGGVQRYGLAVWGPGEGPVEEVWLEGCDLSGPLTSPGGRSVALVASSGGFGPDHLEHHPYVLDAANLSLRPVPTDREVWAVPQCWLSESRLLATAERDSARTLQVCDLSGGTWSERDTGTSVLSVSAAGEDRIVAIHSGIDTPPYLTAGDLDGPYEERVESSAPVTGLTGPLERHRVVLDEVPMGYALCLPPPGVPVRGLVAMFHGGPTMSWCDWSWRWNPWPFTRLGFAVALLEPPMSSGYGTANMAAGWRAWRSGIGAGAVALVEEVRTRHGLDGVPLIAMGGSFGGYLALHAACELDVRLAVAHASPAGLSSVAYGSAVLWSWVREYGHPLDEARLYDEESVSPRLVRPGTRVLLSHGMADHLVPYTESVRAHRILVREGVDSELVLFRDEGHALRQPGVVADWYRWTARACLEAAATTPGQDRFSSVDMGSD
ncbi:prolyl oligopeptidase family serine peptidase [Sphaerisporangium sp. NBC_01403]|uniref:alpha/beta hydrolase family protein n=1 Tax=Sphaerisporangium sp. NBC_01403 TaxID=2903599 RepID=UPI003251EAFB